MLSAKCIAAVQNQTSNEDRSASHNTLTDANKNLITVDGNNISHICLVNNNNVTCYM